jgi:hypothetical protein
VCQLDYRLDTAYKAVMHRSKPSDERSLVTYTSLNKILLIKIVVSNFCAPAWNLNFWETHGFPNPSSTGNSRFPTPSLVRIQADKNAFFGVFSVRLPGLEPGIPEVYGEENSVRLPGLEPGTPEV